MNMRKRIPLLPVVALVAGLAVPLLGNASPAKPKTTTQDAPRQKRRGISTVARAARRGTTIRPATRRPVQRLDRSRRRRARRVYPRRTAPNPWFVPTTVVIVQPAQLPVLDEVRFRQLLKAVADASFSTNRVQLVRNMAQQFDFEAWQVAQIVAHQTFSDERLRVIEATAPGLVDRENAQLILDQLTFMTTKSSARNILGIQ